MVGFGEGPEVLAEHLDVLLDGLLLLLAALQVGVNVVLVVPGVAARVRAIFAARLAQGLFALFRAVLAFDGFDRKRLGGGLGDLFRFGFLVVDVGGPL